MLNSYQFAKEPPGTGPNCPAGSAKGIPGQTKLLSPQDGDKQLTKGETRSQEQPYPQMARGMGPEGH